MRTNVTGEERRVATRSGVGGRGPFRLGFALALVCVWSGAALAENYRARYARPEEPVPFKWRLTYLQLGLSVEDEYERDSFEGGTDSTYERSFISPTLWWGISGSVYHPNLLRFSLLGDFAYGWSRQQPDSGADTSEMERYGHISGTAYVFAGKPLSGTFHGSYGRSYREYDFFTRTTVEADNYGTRWTYREPSFDAGASLAHSDESSLASFSPHTSSHNDTLNLDAHRRRLYGSSSLSYTMNRASYTVEGSTPAVTDHALTLSDGGTFGPNSRAVYTSGASFNRNESEEGVIDQVSANASLGLAHPYGLGSSYAASYDRVMVGDFASESLSGSASLSHQLYQSLGSSISVNDSEARSGSAGNRAESRSYGGSWSESYSKRLGSLHRLQLQGSLSLQRAEQGGNDRGVNERHSFPVPPAIESFFLNLPDVIESSIVVKDALGLRTYVRGFDYEVFPAGSRLEVRRIPGGTIPEGATVIVDYRSTPGKRGTFESVGRTYGGRLYLWRNLLQVYGRVNESRNNATEDMNAPETTTRVAGAVLGWRAFNASAEYQEYESDDMAYRSASFSESYYFAPDGASSLSLALTQAFLEREDSGRSERDYRFTVRYYRSFTGRLQVGAEGGVDRRQGEEVDQTLQVLRANLQYSIGRTHIQATFDREEDNYQNREQRDQNRFTLTWKRDI